MYRSVNRVAVGISKSRFLGLRTMLGALDPSVGLDALAERGLHAKSLGCLRQR